MSESPKGAGIRSPLCGRQTLRIIHSNGGAAGYTKHQGGSTAGSKCPFHASDLHYLPSPTVPQRPQSKKMNITTTQNWEEKLEFG